MVSASEIKLLEERVANYKLQIEQVYASNDQHIDESKLLGELLLSLIHICIPVYICIKYNIDVSPPSASR